jgi:hypothetical protein
MQNKNSGRVFVSENHFHARQAAVALLKMAKSTTDPEVAANLVRVAADLKDQAGELPPPLRPEPPDVQTEVQRSSLAEEYRRKGKIAESLAEATNDEMAKSRFRKS